MLEEKNKYYIRLNENNQIIHFFSEIFEQPIESDILIGRGVGSQFRVSSEVLSEDLQEYAEVENGLPYFENGIYQLKYNNGIIQRLSAEEIQEELEFIQAEIPPTSDEVINAKIDYMAMVMGVDLEVLYEY